MDKYDKLFGNGTKHEVINQVRLLKAKTILNTAIPIWEEELEFLENHVHTDNDNCYYDLHGFCQNHQHMQEGVCSNVIIIRKKEQLKQNIKQAKQLYKEITGEKWK